MAQKLLLGTIDLGAHFCRLLLAECNQKTKETEILEDLSVSVPLGSDVFRHGKISEASIRMLCGIFSNFKKKLDEYGVKNCRAIATSAVREAGNADILIERIRHATGLTLTIFEGADEARLDYLTLVDVMPSSFNLYKRTALIADIGTGACQISSYKGGSFCFTETVKLGTLRVLDQMPGVMSAEGIRRFLTPVIDKTFTEMRQISPEVRSPLLFAMGSSVRALMQIFADKPGNKGQICKLSRKDYEAGMAELLSLSLENITDRYGIPQALAEAVIPCSIIIENLFRISGATTLIVPKVTMKEALLRDFMQDLFHSEDIFARQTEAMVQRTAEKYRSDKDYTRRTALFADKLFIQLQNLHGCPKRAALLLRIAAWLHKTGLFINNQSYHIHSYYIINSTEIPGISQEERTIAALTARFHRKSPPDKYNAEFMAIPKEDQSTVRKLAALLRIACGLADTCRSVTQFRIDLEPDRVVLTPAPELRMTGFAIPEQDVEFFRQVFAVPLLVK